MRASAKALTELHHRVVFLAPAPDVPLIVPVTLSSQNDVLSTGTNTSSLSPETLVVSFPFPALDRAPPSLLALPISLAISSLPPSPQLDGPKANLRVVITTPEAVLQYFGAAQDRTELEQKFGRILRETGVIGFAVEAVVRALQTRAQ